MSMAPVPTPVTQTSLGDIRVFSRPVHPALHEWVIQLSGFIDSGTVGVRRRELPLVGTPIILTFGSPYRLRLRLPSAPDMPVIERHHFLAGLHQTYTESESSGPNWSIEIYLTPPGAYAVLGMPLHELTNRFVGFDDIFGAPGRHLITDLEQAMTWEQRFDLVEVFLLCRLDRGRRPSSQVMWSWQQLEVTRRQTRIGTLADELGWSRRHLVASFREQLGLPPKLVVRQLRFSSATDLLCRSDLPLVEIANRLHYADQAHFTREFREFSGETPARYRAVQASGS